jgi:Mrp family chromosome partitioning ATPase
VAKSLTEQHALLTDYAPHSAYSEAFYTLFANIRSLWQKDAAKTHSLNITTPAAYGDYASVAVNLAIVAAQSGMQTILVESNLRKPSLQQRFGLEQPKGLSDLLVDESLTPEKIEACLQKTFVPHLEVLVAGSDATRDQALLLSPRLNEVIQTLCKEPDSTDSTDTTESGGKVVLFHSPSVLSGANAALIGTQTEYTILAIIANRTTREQAKQAQERLKQAHVPIAGIVLVNA